MARRTPRAAQRFKAYYGPIELESRDAKLLAQIDAGCCIGDADGRKRLCSRGLITSPYASKAAITHKGAASLALFNAEKTDAKVVNLLADTESHDEGYLRWATKYKVRVRPGCW